MTKLNTIGKHETKIYNDNDYTCIKYHYTDVVQFNNDRIILNSNGFFTNTTKTRMNQASRQYNLGYYVFQKDYKWYIDYNSQVLDYYDYIELKRN